MSGSQVSRRSNMDSGVDITLSSLVEDTSPCRLKYDPLIGEGRYSPTEFVKYEQEPTTGIDFTSPAKMYIEDSNYTPFMDAVPDTMLESFNSSTVFSPSSLTGEENPYEVFQDLRHTSTPKQVDITDIERSERSQAKKRIKFNEGLNSGQSVSWHVLHDITSHNIIPHRSDSFIKISDSFTKKRPLIVSEPETPVIRKVPILRGNNRRNCKKASVSCVESTRQSTVKDFLLPDRNPSVRERDKWLYYTGFTDYDRMFRVLSHISVPSEEGLSPFQIIIMTLMRLNCDLDFRDLSHRFQIFEPTVFSLFHSTLSVLSYSLSELIPWTLPPSPRANITVFLYPLPFRSFDSIKTIVIFLTDSKCPILYVSEPLVANQGPLTLLPSMSCYFHTDDQICIKGMSRLNKPTFLKIASISDNKMTYRYVESKNCSHKEKFLKSCMATLKAIREYKLILSKTPVTDENMKRIVNVVCSLVNIKSFEHICDSTLRNIYKRSYRAPCASQSLLNF